MRGADATAGADRAARALTALQERGEVRIRPGEGGPSFAGALEDALGEVQGLQDRAAGAVEAFLRGEPVEIHEVMAAADEAGIALDLLIELRNKLTEAYRAVIQMQS